MIAGEKTVYIPHLERVPLEEVRQHPAPGRLVQKDAEVGGAGFWVGVMVSTLDCMRNSE